MTELSQVPSSFVRGVAGVTAAYCAAFLTVLQLFGVGLYPLSVLPVLYAAWALGRRGSTGVWCVVLALHLVSLAWASESVAALDLTFVMGSVTLLTLGLGMGTLREHLDTQLGLGRRAEERLERAARTADAVLGEGEAETGGAYLRHTKFGDGPTGLPGRALFLDKLAHAHARMGIGGRAYAVLLTNIDRFTVVNAGLGFAAGDLFLTEVGKVLRGRIRETDTIAHLGGDEFAVLLEDLDPPQIAEEIAAELLAALCHPIEVEGHGVVAAASIGLSRVLGRDLDPEDVLREASIAMEKAKGLGGGRVALYDPAFHVRVSERLDLENELRRALDAQALDVHYQPIVDVESGIVVGFEALARWLHPRLGPVSPAKFIPVAEEAGLIEQLGEYVLRVACRQGQRLRHEFPDAPAFRMAVNISVGQLARSDLNRRVEDVLASTGFSADYLSLEITESGLLEDIELATRTFSALQALGVRLAMDDFGTGYSSMRYLRHFRIDTLKLDGSFVRDPERTGEEICAAVITLGLDLGLSVVAEGVERPEQLERLRRLGCRLAQGFLLSRPLPASELEVWLAQMPGFRIRLAS